MEVTLLAVGRLRPYYREAGDDYARRLSRYLRLHEVEVREASRAGSVPRQRAEEASRIRERLPARAVIVVLARPGKPWTSEALAAVLSRWQEGARPVALVIGGSQGLDPALVSEADQIWSLGPLTLPHELARVVVLEQLYRACTILRGEPYHKGKAAG
jgi:23S rRNA (pseudouridine1915-N3)-methyltransferase